MSFSAAAACGRYVSGAQACMCCCRLLSLVWLPHSAVKHFHPPPHLHGICMSQPLAPPPWPPRPIYLAHFLHPPGGSLHPSVPESKLTFQRCNKEFVTRVSLGGTERPTLGPVNLSQVRNTPCEFSSRSVRFERQYATTRFGITAEYQRRVLGASKDLPHEESTASLQNGWPAGGVLGNSSGFMQFCTTSYSPATSQRL